MNHIDIVMTKEAMGKLKMLKQYASKDGLSQLKNLVSGKTVKGIEKQMVDAAGRAGAGTGARFTRPQVRGVLANMSPGQEYTYLSDSLARAKKMQNTARAGLGALGLGGAGATGLALNNRNNQNKR